MVNVMVTRDGFFVMSKCPFVRDMLIKTFDFEDLWSMSLYESTFNKSTFYFDTSDFLAGTSLVPKTCNE
jgi:hypothetical protein